MINRNASRQVTPSFIPKFSDADIILTIMNSDFWKHLFLGERKALWIFVKGLVFLKMEMFISPLRSVLRIGPGKRTTGIIITVLSACMMMAFNAEHVIGYVVTFVPFVMPLIPFLMDGDQLYGLAFVDVKSSNLIMFWMTYVVLNFVHLIVIYRGKSGDGIQRGTSILYLIQLKKLRFPKEVIQGVVEPVLSISVGYTLCVTMTDMTLGLFIIIAGFCLFLQELYDIVLQFAIRR